MSAIRPLRGSCCCGRYRYTVERPLETTELAQVFFNSSRLHDASIGSPMPAFLRIPLSWYHSTTHAQFPDETHTKILSVYWSPETTTRRSFCGYCGTPLSFWSEQPRSEADYIQVSLGSLLPEDLHDLQELGYVRTDTPDSEHLSVLSIAITEGATKPHWFDSFINEHVRRQHGQSASSGGKNAVELEMVELTSDDDDSDGAAADSGSASGSSKRKRSDTEMRP